MRALTWLMIATSLTAFGCFSGTPQGGGGDGDTSGRTPNGDGDGDGQSGSTGGAYSGGGGMYGGGAGSPYPYPTGGAYGGGGYYGGSGGDYAGGGGYYGGSGGDYAGGVGGMSGSGGYYGGGAPAPYPFPGPYPGPFPGPFPFPMPGPVPGTGELPDLGECEQQEGWEEPSFCELGLSCEQGYAWVHCGQDPDRDSWWCGCERDYGYAEFRVQGATQADACGKVADLCTQGYTPDPDTEEVCEPTYREGYAEYCSREEQCSRSQDVGDGVSVETVDYHRTYCYGEDDQWSCECSSNGGNLRIELSGSQTSPGVCGDAFDACHGDGLSLSDDLSCAPRYQSADRYYCDTGLECSRSGTLGDMPVTAYESRNAHCSRSESDGPWQCQCGNFYGGTAFELQSDSGWDACTEAGMRCAAE